MLALARQDAEPVVETLRSAPPLPVGGQWATFLRNHDEVDLSQLTPEQQVEVFAALGPDESMQIYGRGIRRRLAPMLRNDVRRIRLAYSLQFTLPGTPVLRYGEEIGMGEDLSLEGRSAVRTPMQWSDSPAAGFSGADSKRLVRPVLADGEYSYQSVNVLRQRRDPESLLSWFERMIRTLRECPEVGVGRCSLLDVPLPRHVMAHRFDAPQGSMLFLHNLADRPVTLDLGEQPSTDPRVVEVFANRGYEPPAHDLAGIELDGYGFRWIRLDRDTGTA
jgi:maltose alpha-D-glucosyltransferase/alpha-amylase